MLHISSWTIIRFFLIALGFVGLFIVREIIVVVFVSFLLAAGLSPLIDMMAKKIPRVLAVVILYLGIISLFVALFFLLKIPIVNETAEFRERFNNGELNLNILGLEVTGEQVSAYIRTGLGQVEFGDFLERTGKFVSGLVGVITAFVITFYFLLDRTGIQKMLSSFLPINLFEDAVELINKTQHKLGYWLRGQIALMVIIGAITTIALLILGIPYAATLGLIAGLTEAIPTIGPIIGAVFALLITAATVPDKLLIVLILYIIIQWLENSLIVPVVMKKALGLSPVAVLISILIGAKLMGVVGAILSVPTIAALTVIVNEWPGNKSKKSRA